MGDTTESWQNQSLPTRCFLAVGVIDGGTGMLVVVVVGVLLQVNYMCLIKYAHLLLEHTCRSLFWREFGYRCALHLYEES